MLSRNITIIINWILDNVVPPFMREWRWLMSFIIGFAYGKKTKYIMEFKDKYPFMNQEAINEYYSLIADVPINKKRKTDLNSECINYILSNINGKTVLDAACGRGLMVEKFLEQGYDTTGLDVVKPENCSFENSFVQGTLQKMPFEDSQFDTVICTHALEHIREYKEAIAELIRVTKKRLIIVMPKQREYKYTPDLHVNFCPYLYRFQEFLAEGGIDPKNSFILNNDFVCVYDIEK